MQINLIFSDNVQTCTKCTLYFVYPAISKHPQQLPNCLKIAATSVVLIVFNSIVCDVSAYTVSVSLCCSTWIIDAFLGPWVAWLNNTEVYLTPCISTQNHTTAG
jgi:hypothetical protein